MVMLNLDRGFGVLGFFTTRATSPPQRSSFHRRIAVSSLWGTSHPLGTLNAFAPFVFRATSQPDAPTVGLVHRGHGPCYQLRRNQRPSQNLALVCLKTLWAWRGNFKVGRRCSGSTPVPATSIAKTVCLPFSPGRLPMQETISPTCIG